MLAEINETEATGDIAAIFEDVRRLWGVPYVSAIQRHLATRPGVLEWAWEAVGPAFQSGAAQRAAHAAVQGLAVPPLMPIPREALTLWGVDEKGLAAIRGCAEGFVRVAPINMMFAGLMTALLGGASPGGGGGASSHEPAWTVPPPLPAPPSMVAPDKLDAAARSVLMRFATMNDGKPFVPGLYRMLAHWPAFLAHLATVLPPRLSEPAVASAFDLIRKRIDEAVPGVLAGLPSTPTRRPMPSTAERTHFQTIRGTYRKTSPELVVLGTLIGDALPR